MMAFDRIVVLEPKLLVVAGGAVTVSGESDASLLHNNVFVMSVGDLHWLTGLVLWVAHSLSSNSDMLYCDHHR